ncbi:MULTISPECIES: DUF2797 domain-containing protein [Thalassolituus]|uniref:DUF2797 domain-containing protein n=1 Tax=Thalassolituus TaxID=187492 RepID=UPI001E3C8E20|nr:MULTISPECIES: DUF2797 domain-containing protein [Thalassolituus]MCB2385428.1 DUF2797 domain-containing protein [Thalassolituus alkanivorans]MCB2423317.1 DUF2797 domain-containing protein [Thalassolituus alkanivorans]
MTQILASGLLSKMALQAGEHDDVVQYQLVLDDQRLDLNPLIGRHIEMTYSGAIHCSHCGRRTKTSFSQGYCYPCFTSLAQCDSCMMSPEKCHFSAGTCREPSWAEQVCFNDHIVYLANSSGLKVGITRATQMPVRWLDQGAAQALPIARVKNRRLSGLIEDLLRSQVADKTNWRTLLKGPAAVLDLAAERDRLLSEFSQPLAELEQREGVGSVQLLHDADVWQFDYPVSQYPGKISSFNFDKNPQVSGRLLGLKGQYLILDGGVINLRKFSSYHISFALKD